MYGLWDENALSLGVPRCMDTPTLIEWIEQQLETKEETLDRHARLVEEQVAQDYIGRREHWINGLIQINESRSEREYREAVEAMRKYADGSQSVMYLPEGVTYLNLGRNQNV